MWPRGLEHNFSVLHSHLAGITGFSRVLAGLEVLETHTGATTYGLPVERCRQIPFASTIPGFCTSLPLTKPLRPEFSDSAAGR